MKYVGIFLIIIIEISILNPITASSQDLQKLYDKCVKADNNHNTNQAIKCFTKLYHKADKNKYRFLLNRGAEYLKGGYSQKAIQDLSSFIKNDTTRGTAYLFRALANRNEKNWDGAISDISKAINAKHQTNVYSKPILFYKRGEFKASSDKYSFQDIGKDFDRAINLNPKNSLIYLKAGVLYSSFGPYLNKGCAYLRKAYEMGNKDAIKFFKKNCRLSNHKHK